MKAVKRREGVTFRGGMTYKRKMTKLVWKEGETGFRDAGEKKVSRIEGRKKVILEGR